MVFIDLILLVLLAFFEPFLALVPIALIGFIGISALFFNAPRMLLDTYISCLHGIVTSFTRKKTWVKEADDSRQKLVEGLGTS